MKNKAMYILLVLIFVAGLSLLLYPTISNAYNAWLHSKAIVEYADKVDDLEQELFEKQWQAAQNYNRTLLERTNPFELTPEQDAQYWNLLDLTGKGIMAYVEIPSVDVVLPIAHGTEESTLKEFVGHLAWSSLPVGGESTHSVISGHRGLPSSELFTNIDHMALGDKFYIHVLGQTLEYQVCNIAVVEPQDQRLLQIVEGKDLVTLVTCTPYGINSHRLLVQGIRTGTVDTEQQQLPIKNETTEIELVVLIPVILVAVSAVIFIVMLFGGKKKKVRRKQDEQQENH